MSIQDERLKLQATALNNLGTAAAVTGIFGPIFGSITGSFPSPTAGRLAATMLFFLVVAIVFYDAARRRLGGLSE